MCGWLCIILYIDSIIMKLLPLFGIITIIFIPFNSFSSTARDRAIEHDEYKRRQKHITKYVSSLIIKDLRRYKFAKDIDKAMNKVTKLETTYRNTRVKTELDVIVPTLTTSLMHTNGNIFYIFNDINRNKYIIGLHLPLN